MVDRGPGLVGGISRGRAGIIRPVVATVFIGGYPFLAGDHRIGSSVGNVSDLDGMVPVFAIVIVAGGEKGDDDAVVSAIISPEGLIGRLVALQRKTTGDSGSVIIKAGLLLLATIPVEAGRAPRRAVIS